MIDVRLKFLQGLQLDIETAGKSPLVRDFTNKEKDRFLELEADLQLLLNESRLELLKEQSPLIHPMDIYLVCGHRNKQNQTAAVIGGFSKVYWPHGKHNKLPSHAMDICPIVWNGSKYVLEWNDLEKFRYIIKLMMRVAKRLEAEGKIKKIRFGADFNMDGNLMNDKWVDMPHCEIT